MAQHDLVIENGPGFTVRQDINAALAALGSLQSGSVSPTTTTAYQWWADTGTGLLKQRNATNSAWIVRGSLSDAMTVARSSNTTLTAGDYGKTVVATGTWTQTIAAVSSIGAGWWVAYRNNGTGTITIDPSGSETIDGASAITLSAGESCHIVCSGGALVTVGRAPLASPAFTGTPTAPTAPAGTKTKQIANTEFVHAIFASIVTVAPGTIFFTSGSSAPARSLKANGAAVSRTAYAALFEAIGTMYGSGDGSTTFNLPDLRGEFLRCLDDGRGVDAGRTLNSFQGDAIRNIAGKIGDLTLSGNSSSGAFYANGTVNSQWHGPSYIPRTSMFMDASRVVPTANENRPRNIALLACIAY